MMLLSASLVSAPLCNKLIIFDRSVVKDPRDVSSIYFDDLWRWERDYLTMIRRRAYRRASYDDLKHSLYIRHNGEPKGSCFIIPVIWNSFIHTMTVDDHVG